MPGYGLEEESSGFMTAVAAFEIDLHTDDAELDEQRDELLAKYLKHLPVGQALFHGVMVENDFVQTDLDGGHAGPSLAVCSCRGTRVSKHD